MAEEDTERARQPEDPIVEQISSTMVVVTGAKVKPLEPIVEGAPEAVSVEPVRQAVLPEEPSARPNQRASTEKIVLITCVAVAWLVTAVTLLKLSGIL